MACLIQTLTAQDSKPKRTQIILMKQTMIIFTLSIVFLDSVFAQSFMTNTIAECAIPEYKYGKMANAINALSRAYNVRICMEDSTANDWIRILNAYEESNYKTNALSEKEVIMIYENFGVDFTLSATYTNATFGYVLGIIMESMNNHVWRYESSTDSIYIYPATNAFSLTYIGSVSITNKPIKSICETENLLNLATNTIGCVGDKLIWSWPTENISLELENAYLWQVLDAITSKIRDGRSWEIREINPSYYFNNAPNYRYGLHVFGPYQTVLDEWERN